MLPWGLIVAFISVKKLYNSIITTLLIPIVVTVPQDEYARSVKEMVESHATATTPSLTEEFRKQIESKLAEQKKDMKVKKHLHMQLSMVDIPIVKL